MALQDMFPNATRDDRRDGMTSDTKRSREVGYIRLTCFMALPYLAYLCLSQLSVWLFLTVLHPSGIDARDVLIAACLPALLHLVGGVLGAGSQEQVIRIDAQRCIAAMAYALPIRNWAVGQLIRKTVNAYRLARLVGAASYSKLAVPIAGNRSCPQPTVIGLVDFRPEASGERSGSAASGARRGRGTLGAHRSLPSVSCSGVRPTLPERFVASIIACQSPKLSIGGT